MRALRIASILFAWMLLGHIVGVLHADEIPGAVRCGGTGEKSCLLTNSAFVDQYMKPGALVTFCYDARASGYPGFVQQTTKVLQGYADFLGFTIRQVPMPAKQTDMGCVLRNEMPAVHGCPKCGAWVYVSLLPMIIEFNWQAGYTQWESTDGHELGHGLCLEDEHYDKPGFRSFILTFGYWIKGYPTVMDIGTWQLREYSPLGIWLPTLYDLARCSETLGRNVVPPPPPPACGLGSPDEFGNRWDSCGQWWLLTDGGHFRPNAGCGQFFRPDGKLEWDGCDSWGGGARFNQIAQLWFARDGGIFNVANGSYVNIGRPIQFP